MNKFSLSTLAHLSRCLFPNDFYRELIEMGVSEENARMLSNSTRSRLGNKNILEVYQDWISDEEMIAIIEQYVIKFEAKWG